MQDFRNLKVWKKGHSFAIKIYKITRQFPKHELYGITSQIRKASTSIAANISEGCGRGSTQELIRFLYIAMGSASEVEYFIILSRDLEINPHIHFNELLTDIREIKKMLSTLIKRLRSMS